MSTIRMKKTPPINTRGRYLLLSPFDALIVPNEIYECVAIRQFSEIEELGQKVYDTYYKPFNVPNALYGEDKRLDANIITLATITGEYFYVPDTFIAEFPNGGTVAYHRVVLSIDLGPIPETLDLTFLQQQISSVTTDVVGLSGDREPIVYVAIAPTRGVIDAGEHEIMEAARDASIRNRTTDRAKVVELTKLNTALNARLAFLEQYIRDKQL